MNQDQSPPVASFAEQQAVYEIRGRLGSITEADLFCGYGVDVEEVRP
jgi:hypothetical protein